MLKDTETRTKTALITGATSGIGKALHTILLKLDMI
jgi:short-subunit dehydrogenase